MAGLEEKERKIMELNQIIKEQQEKIDILLDETEEYQELKHVYQAQQEQIAVLSC